MMTIEQFRELKIGDKFRWYGVTNCVVTNISGAIIQAKRLIRWEKDLVNFYEHDVPYVELIDEEPEVEVAEATTSYSQEIQDLEMRYVNPGSYDSLVSLGDAIVLCKRLEVRVKELEKHNDYFAKVLDQKIDAL